MLRRSSNKYCQGNNPKRLVARGLLFGRKKEFDWDEVQTAEKLQKRLALCGWEPSIIDSSSWRMQLKGETTLPTSVRYSFLPGRLGYFLTAGTLGITGTFGAGYAIFKLWLQEKEPLVIGRLACELTEKNRQKLAAEATDPSLCLLSAAEVESFKDDINHKGPVMVYIIGPKCIGKSVTLARVPEMLELKKSIYIQYDFVEDVPLKKQLYDKLHSIAVQKGYPPRPHGESPDTYLTKVFKNLGGKDAVLLLDLNRAREKDWARGFADELRQVWSFGINVFVTTSEGEDIAESKLEQRRKILLFSELPMEAAKKYVKQRFTNLNVTDKELEEVLGSIPRDFLSIQEIKDWKAMHGTIAERDAYYERNVRAAFSAAKCASLTVSQSRSRTKYPALNNLIAGKVLNRESIQDSCLAPDAVQILLKSNVLRHCTRVGTVTDRNPDRGVFTLKHDCLRNAFLHRASATPTGAGSWWSAFTTKGNGSVN